MSNDDYFNPINNINNYWTQEAIASADTARLNEISAQRELDSQKFANNSNVELIIQLRNNAHAQHEKIQQLETENMKLASAVHFFEHLFSLPMKEIAEKNNLFKEAYEAEQLILAKWILSQKAYAETAIQIGLESGKNIEEVKEIYRDNVSSVLANATKHGNNAVTNPILKQNMDKIIGK